MSDLISRQAAINVIDAVFPVDPMKSEYAQGIACGAALAKTYVEQLPSAQPEIIHCKDCKYYVYGDNEEEYYCRNSGIGELETFYCADAERRKNER